MVRAGGGWTPHSLLHPTPNGAPTPFRASVSLSLNGVGLNVLSVPECTLPTPDLKVGKGRGEEVGEGTRAPAGRR
jgi:hypothetical protein